MQKILLAAIALTLAATPLAAADTYSGSILVGHPVTAVIGGVTENAEPCTPGGATAGIDGVWFDIGDVGGMAFSLTMDDTLDADVWFYTASCAFIDSNVGALAGFGTLESGAVPAGAKFAVVDGFAGTGGFQLTVG